MKNEIKEFIENWGQTTEEICANLGYDTEDSDDLLTIDYFYDSLYNVWLPKSNSMYSKDEQEIADKLS